MCSGQVHFRLRTCSITSVTCVFSVTQMFVFLSRYVVFNCPSLFMRLLDLFVLCLGGECPCFRAICHCWKYAWVVDFSRQAYSSITFDDIAVLDECWPSGRDSSLNIIILVFVSGAVYLSQVDVAFKVCRFHHHLCLRLVFLQTLIVTFIS